MVTQVLDVDLTEDYCDSGSHRKERLCEIHSFKRIRQKLASKSPKEEIQRVNIINVC